MSLDSSIRSFASPARATTAVLATIALLVAAVPAQALATMSGTTVRRVHHAARTRAHAHARAHLRARLHARHRGHLHALAIAADEGPSEAGGASLHGSPAAVDRAYAEAVHEGLPFVRSRAELERRAADGEYVPLAHATATYRLKGVGSSYVRRATRDFVTSFAADYSRQCGEPLTVTSAMRPTSVRLRNSVQKSVHPTGMAVDLRASRTGCRGWMRATLLDMERRGVIDATEEHHPAHFHVVVLRQG